MARTVIDLDDIALANAAEVLGTKTKVETVNTALREVAARNQRIAAVKGLIDAANVFGAPGEREGAWGMDEPAGCGP